MELIRFGGWSVNPYAIEWLGNFDIQLTISIKDLAKTGINKKSILYHWLIEVAKDTRFTPEDIYALNTAFFYAIDLFKAELDIPGYVLIAETIIAQHDIMVSRNSESLRSTKNIN